MERPILGIGNPSIYASSHCGISKWYSLCTGSLYIPQALRDWRDPRLEKLTADTEPRLTCGRWSLLWERAHGWVPTHDSSGISDWYGQWDCFPSRFLVSSWNNQVFLHNWYFPVVSYGVAHSLTLLVSPSSLQAISRVSGSQKNEIFLVPTLCIESFCKITLKIFYKLQT